MSRKISVEIRATQGSPNIVEPKIEYPAQGLGTSWFKRIEIFEPYKGVSEASERLNPLGSNELLKNKRFDRNLLNSLAQSEKSIQFFFDNSKRYLNKEEQSKVKKLLERASIYLKTVKSIDDRWRNGFMFRNVLVPKWPLEKSFQQVCPSGEYEKRQGASRCPSKSEASGRGKDLELSVRLLEAAAVNLQAARVTINKRRVFFKNMEYYEAKEPAPSRAASGSGSAGVLKSTFRDLEINPKAPPNPKGLKDALRKKGLLGEALEAKASPTPTAPTPEEKLDFQLMELIESGADPIDFIVRFVDQTLVEDSREVREQKYQDQKFEFLSDVQNEVSLNFQLLEDYESFPILALRGSIDDIFVVAEYSEASMLEAYTPMEQAGIDAAEKPVVDEPPAPPQPPEPPELPELPELPESTDKKPIKKKSDNTFLIVAIGVGAFLLLGRK